MHHNPQSLSSTPDAGNEALWQQIFALGHPALLKQHRWHRRLPHDPRCRLCCVPFRGLGGWLMRWRGKARNNRNPYFCNACDAFLQANPGGAEVELSILYVDIRRSTEYAAGATPAQVGQRINHFLDAVTRVITRHDGFLLAFYGDCVVAVWPPGFSGLTHAEKCLVTAQQLVAEPIVHSDGQEIPVGVGAHAGLVYIGTVAALSGSFRDVSVFGESVNITARLADQAKAGEALASRSLLECAGREGRLSAFNLKGIATPVEAASF